MSFYEVPEEVAAAKGWARPADLAGMFSAVFKMEESFVIRACCIPWAVSQRKPWAVMTFSYQSGAPLTFPFSFSLSALPPTPPPSLYRPLSERWRHNCATGFFDADIFVTWRCATAISRWGPASCLGLSIRRGSLLTRCFLSLCQGTDNLEKFYAPPTFPHTALSRDRLDTETEMDQQRRRSVMYHVI